MQKTKPLPANKMKPSSINPNNVSTLKQNRPQHNKNPRGNQKTSNHHAAPSETVKNIPHIEVNPPLHQPEGKQSEAPNATSETQPSTSTFTDSPEVHSINSSSTSFPKDDLISNIFNLLLEAYRLYQNGSPLLSILTKLWPSVSFLLSSIFAKWP